MKSADSRAAWDRAYERHGELWSRSHDVWFQVSDDDRVLDLGCGTGKSCENLPGKIVGADFSLTALRMAKQKHPDVNHICCDITSLPFKDSVFDFVRASFVFGHLSDVEREIAIDETARVMSNGADLAVEIFSKNDGRYGREETSDRGKSINGSGIAHYFFDMNEMLDLLSSFEIKDSNEITWNQRIGEGESMRRSIFRIIAMKSTPRKQ